MRLTFTKTFRIQSRAYGRCSARDNTRPFVIDHAFRSLENQMKVSFVIVIQLFEIECAQELLVC